MTLQLSGMPLRSAGVTDKPRGQINRLKNVKRQMYGRAALDSFRLFTVSSPQIAEDPLNRFFRTFGAASKPLRSANPLSIRE
jgi:hypothetical protein